MRLKINLFEEYPYLDISQANMLFSAIMDMKFDASQLEIEDRTEAIDRNWLIDYEIFTENLFRRAVAVNAFLHRWDRKAAFDLGPSPEKTDMIALRDTVYYLLSSTEKKADSLPATGFDGYLNTLPQELQNVLRPRLVLIDKYMHLLKLWNEEPEANVGAELHAFYMDRVEQSFAQVNEILKQNGFPCLFQ